MTGVQTQDERDAEAKKRAVDVDADDRRARGQAAGAEEAQDGDDWDCKSAAKCIDEDSGKGDGYRPNRRRETQPAGSGEVGTEGIENSEVTSGAWPATRRRCRGACASRAARRRAASRATSGVFSPSSWATSPSRAPFAARASRSASKHAHGTH